MIGLPIIPLGARGDPSATVFAPVLRFPADDGPADTLILVSVQHPTLTVRGGGDVGTIHAARIGERGDSLWAKSWRYHPKPLTDAGVDSVITAFAAASQGRERKGGDGSPWLRREGGIASESVEWLVANRRGTPVARVTLPSTTEPLWVSEDRIWAREAGALGLVYLVAYIVDDGS